LFLGKKLTNVMKEIAYLQCGQFKTLLSSSQETTVFSASGIRERLYICRIYLLFSTIILGYLPLFFNLIDISLLPLDPELAFGLSRLPILSIDEAEVVLCTTRWSLPDPMVAVFNNEGFSTRDGVSDEVCILAS
jgi:hypothetical protein